MERDLSDVLNGEKFKTARVECSFRKSQRVEVENIELLPEEFLKCKDPEANKTAISKAIKEGKEIAGVRLVNALNLQIK